MKFSGFHNTKTSANKRLLLCLLPFAADVQTSPAQVHGAKVLQNLRMCKKNHILVRFFWCGVYGVECKGRNLLGRKSPSTKQTGGKCPNDWGEFTIIGNLFRKLVNFLRKWVNLCRKWVNFFRKPILTKSTFWLRGVESEFSRSSVGVLSVK